MNYIKKIKIGQVLCKTNLFLAPMAGITDSPFRIMCLKGGAGLVCAEMVSANALAFDNKKSQKMLSISKEEHPVSMQVFGSEEETIANACKLAEKQGADIIDINAGCPVKKVNKAGAGAVLMKDLPKLARIVNAAVKSVKIPITLKTRIGLTCGNLLACDLVKLAQDNGAAAITLHARYASQMHNGEPDLKALEKARAVCKIPLIANGGAVDGKTTNALFETGANAVMIGRGAIGNPFLFTELATGKEALTFKEKMALFEKLVEQNVIYYGEKTGVSRTKKVVGFWVKGVNQAAILRQKLVLANTLKEVKEILNAVK